MVYMKKLVIGILAHVDAGKTTLSEGMLYLSGSINKLGRVDHKDAFLDHNNLERERGITIFSKQALLPLPEVHSGDQLHRRHPKPYGDPLAAFAPLSDPHVPVHQQDGSGRRGQARSAAGASETAK